jgi:hypothetical protein
MSNGARAFWTLARTPTSVPLFVTLFRFLRKLNDPVDRLRSEMICGL